MPTSMTGGPVNRLPTLVLGLALAALACNLPFEGTGSQDSGAMVEGYPSSFGQGELTEFSLSQAQQAIIRERGYPNRFTIRFFLQSWSDDQAQPVRLETWYYDDEGYQVAFQNGEQAGARRLEPLALAGLGRTSYHPEQFVAFITMDELVGITGQSDFYQQPLSDKLVEDGQLIWLEGLSAGFKGGQLVYLETFPLGQAAQEEPMPTAASLGLDQAPEPEPTEPADRPTEQPVAATLPADPPSDGETIIYVSNPGGNFDIYSVGLESGVSRNLTAHSARDFAVSCSPNNGWLAFVSDRTGNEELFLMDRTGENLRQITKNGTKFKDAITWLSDTELLYWDGSDQSGWFITDTSGAEPEMLPYEQGEALTPDKIVSPDGSASLVEVRMDPDSWDDWDIYLTDASGQHNLTDSPGTTDMFPVWAPDSQRFVYQSDSDGDNELYIMDRQGNILQQLTKNSHYDGSGCWLP